MAFSPGEQVSELRIRDVGVAGSNPVTPTIDFIRVFYLRLLTVPGPRGSRFQKRFQFKRTIRSQNFGCPCTSADIEDPSCDHVGLPVFPPARLAGMRRVTSADLPRARRFRCWIDIFKSAAGSR